MSRTLPTGYAALTTAKTFAPVILVFLDWPGDPVYAWSGYGSISWDGHTWVGTGTQGTLSPVQESSDLKANGVVLSLSGIPSALITKALSNDTQGAVGKVYIGALTSAGALSTDPYLIFEGVIDICPFEDGGETSTISVQLEKELIDRRLNNRRYTHEDQQIDYAGDLFFDYVAALANKEVTWGAKSVAASGLPPGALYPTAHGLQRFE